MIFFLENPTDINEKWLLHCHADIACDQGTQF